MHVTAIRRSYQATTITSNTSTNTQTGSIQTQLSSLPAYSDFTNLFDQYRILKVKIDFMPNLTGNTAGGLPGLYNVFNMAIDHTDTTSPTQSSDILQYDEHRTLQPYKPFSITYKPAPAAAYFNTNVTTGYGPRAGAWIDGSSPAIVHYGLKYSWDCNASTATNIIPYVTVWAEFREAR